MSRVGCPWDNAMAESFMKTLKNEEVDGRRYRDLDEARASIGDFIETVYNDRRLHSALAYQAPRAFEENRRLPAPGHARGPASGGSPRRPAAPGRPGPSAAVGHCRRSR